MNVASVCPRCARPLKAGAPEGLCPACLMRSAMQVMRPPSEMPATVNGREFGEYELLEEIGRGGMGIVFRARHVTLNRTVALKLLLAGEWASPDFVRRFQAEAEAAAALDHPNIVPIYEVGQHEGRYFFSMKLIEGRRLLEHGANDLHAKALPARDELGKAVRVAATVARAIHYAHQRGVLHRDLKPGNILIDARGEPYLLDFGLAKLVEKDTALTRTLAVLGTPAYMAPEQAAGGNRHPTTAMDVYGLGAILFELLTHEPPFAGGTTVETIRQVVHQMPKQPSALNPAVDRDLETICLKCLEKDPTARYGSAEALADDLERWLRREPILARRAAWPERVRKWAVREPMKAALSATILLAAIALATILGWSNQRLRSARSVITSQAEERRQRLVRYSTEMGDRAWREHDKGEALMHYVEALRLDGGRNEPLHRERIQIALNLMSTLAAELEHDGPVNQLALSPNHERLASASADGTVRIWSSEVDGAQSAELTLKHPAAVETVAFNADGSRVLTLARDHQARLWDTKIGELAGLPMPVQAARSSRHETAFRAAVFSPDGARVALSVAKGLELRSATNGLLLQTIAHPARINHCAFTPDGARVAIAAEDSIVALFDVEDGHRVWQTKLMFGARLACFAPDGSRLGIGDAGFRFQVLDAADGKLLFDPVGHRALVLCAEFSPDGSRVVTGSYDNTARLLDSGTGRQLAPLLRHEGAVRAARFDASGTSLLTASDDGTVRRWDAHTGEPQDTRVRHAGAVADARWLGNSRFASAGADGKVRIWQEPKSALRVWRRQGPPHNASFSRDGKHALLVWLDGQVTLEDLTGEKASVVIANAGTRSTAWLSGDSRRVVIATPQGRARIVDAHDQQVVSESASSVGSHLVANEDASRVAVRLLSGQLGLWAASEPDPQTNGLPHIGRQGQLWLSPDRTLLLAAGTDRRLHVVQMNNARPLRDPVKLPGVAYFANWASDNQHAVLVWNGIAQRWNLRTGASAGPELRGEEPFSTATFSHDGRTIAAASEHFVEAFDAASGARLWPPLRHAEAIYAVNFSPEDRRLVTTTSGAAAFLWDAKTGQPAAPPLPHEGYVLTAAFDPDGARLLTADNGGVVRLWDVSATAMSLGELDRLARRMQGR